MKIRFRVEWFDAWAGFYYDRVKRILYFNPFPFMVFSFTHYKNTFIGGKWVDRDRDEETRNLYAEKYSAFDKANSVAGCMGLLFFLFFYLYLGDLFGLVNNYVPTVIMWYTLGGFLTAKAVTSSMEE